MAAWEPILISGFRLSYKIEAVSSEQKKDYTAHR
jgi:hypothetical protein